MSIPTSIDSSHIVKAMRKIDKQVPRYPKWREGRVYELRYKGKVYPPKYLVSISNKYANGKELHGFKGGLQTNNFLIARGFTDIWNKNTGKRTYTTAEESPLEEDFMTPSRRTPVNLSESISRHSTFRVFRQARRDAAAILLKHL